MKCKWKRGMLFFLICVLLISRAYTTYAKADELAKHAVTIAASENDSVKVQENDGIWIYSSTKALLEGAACILQSSNPLRYTIENRQRELRFLGEALLIFYAILFILKSWHFEKATYSYIERYYVALIKYIHDLDGKKRMACLT